MSEIATSLIEPNNLASIELCTHLHDGFTQTLVHLGNMANIVGFFQLARRHDASGMRTFVASRSMTLHGRHDTGGLEHAYLAGALGDLSGAKSPVADIDVAPVLSTTWIVLLRHDLYCILVCSCVFVICV
jgi:hypothetical protein